MGEDRFLGGVAEARGIPLDPARDKARTYAIYLDLIKGQLTAVAGRPRFRRGVPRRRAWPWPWRRAPTRSRSTATSTRSASPPRPSTSWSTAPQVAKKKPAPDIFLEACRRLGLEPSACLVIEDALAGVAAARAAGCRCLAVTTSFPADKLAAAGADWVASGLDHVPVEVLEW